MAKPLVLVVEDERDIADLLAHHLVRDGFEVRLAHDGESGLLLTRRHLPDVVLLDLMLPRLDGLEVCRRIRRDTRTAAIPIVMVTAKDRESDIVSGLELGADDYVTKPFSPAVVVARVRAVRRRREQAAFPAEVLRAGALEIDDARHVVTVDGKAIDLPLTAFKLLRHLAAHPERVFTRSQLLAVVSGPDPAALDRTVDVHIASLRRRLGSQGNRIATVRGVGYKFSGR